MILLKKNFLTTTVAASLLLLAAAYASRKQEQNRGQFTKASLGIEVSQKKPFFMQAATSNKITSAVIRVPFEKGKDLPENSVSAIKLEPRLEKDKVRVTVYAIYGDIQGLKKCADLDALKTVKVDSIVAGPDEEVRVLKLGDYGVKMEKDPFTFRVVSKSIYAPVYDLETGGCPCMTCDLVTCCPNPGYCVPCDCVTVCCKN